MNQKLIKTLQSFKTQGLITVLTGAGISAESGIPTFRGPEGYWKVGSKNYQPQEMATYNMFSQKPYEVWKWYLYRRDICNQALPNPGHFAIVDIEKKFKERFLLITQNVDGLHVRAGNKNIYQIHGNINFMRCTDEGCEGLYEIPEELIINDKEADLSEEQKKKLTCPVCSSLSRPHILWFDECYDEIYYKFDSSLEATRKSDLLIVVGTTGATTLPFRIITTVMMMGKPVIVIDPYENEVTELVESYDNGYYLQHKSGEILPNVAGMF